MVLVLGEISRFCRSSSSLSLSRHLRPSSPLSAWVVSPKDSLITEAAWRGSRSRGFTSAHHPPHQLLPPNHLSPRCCCGEERKTHRESDPSLVINMISPTADLDGKSCPPRGEAPRRCGYRIQAYGPGCHHLRRDRRTQGKGRQEDHREERRRWTVDYCGYPVDHRCSTFASTSLLERFSKRLKA